MSLRQNETKRIVHAPAKLNLFLEVLGRRDDGYHELETLMVPVRLFDSLSFEPTGAGTTRAGDIEFSLKRLDFGKASADSVPVGRDNLVVQALGLLRQRSGCSRGARIELAKRIPSAAGLGGGSSDAAAALRVANEAWGIHWPPEKLASLAAELGSDVPFFLACGPAICRGRGERVERLVGTVPLHVVIVKPPAALATPAVYDKLCDMPAGPSRSDSATHSRRCLDALARTLRRGTLVGIAQWMGNRLEAAAAALSPWIDRVQAAFAELDFVAHQLSGSGTAYFGVCRHASHARRLAMILRTRQLGLVYVTRSCR